MNRKSHEGRIKSMATAHVAVRVRTSRCSFFVTCPPPTALATVQAGKIDRPISARGLVTHDNANGRRLRVETCPRGTDTVAGSAAAVGTSIDADRTRTLVGVTVFSMVPISMSATAPLPVWRKWNRRSPPAEHDPQIPRQCRTHIEPHIGGNEGAICDLHSSAPRPVLSLVHDRCCRQIPVGGEFQLSCKQF